MTQELPSINTFWATIHIAGELTEIKSICQRYCLKGACVSVVPQEFIYSGGRESGAAITMIAYPRFPKDDVVIMGEAYDLANLLTKQLGQRSCSIVTPHKTTYFQNEDLLKVQL